MSRVKIKALLGWKMYHCPLWCHKGDGFWHTLAEKQKIKQSSPSNFRNILLDSEVKTESNKIERKELDGRKTTQFNWGGAFIIWRDSWHPHLAPQWWKKWHSTMSLFGAISAAHSVPGHMGRGEDVDSQYGGSGGRLQSKNSNKKEALCCKRYVVSVLQISAEQ